MNGWRGGGRREGLEAEAEDDIVAVFVATSAVSSRGLGSSSMKRFALGGGEKGGGGGEEGFESLPHAGSLWAKMEDVEAKEEEMCRVEVEEED